MELEKVKNGWRVLLKRQNGQMKVLTPPMPKWRAKRWMNRVQQSFDRSDKKARRFVHRNGVNGDRHS